MTLRLRICCCLLFYWLSSLLLWECKAGSSGRDSAEPIELIPDFDIESHGIPKVNMQNDRPDENPEMQQVLKFIEEKFLSFAALNIRPNFANIFRHMERMARAFVRLNARVDQVHSQVEELKTQHQNCSSSRSPKKSERAIEAVEKKIDQLEKQIQFSTPSIGQQLQQLQQQMQRMETKLDEIVLDKNLNEINEGNAQNDINLKLDVIQSNLSSMMHAQHESRKEIRSNMLNIQEMTHVLGNLQHQRDPGRSSVALDADLGSGQTSQRDIADKFSTIMHQLDLQQQAVGNVTHICGTLLSNSYASQQTQQEKISELVDVMQDLPGIITDAVDKMEIMSDRLQSKLDSSGTDHAPVTSSLMSALHRVEANSIKMLHAVQGDDNQHLERHSKDKESNIAHSVLAELKNLSAHHRTFVSDQVPNVDFNESLTLIQEMMRKVDVGNKLLHNLYSGVKDRTGCETPTNYSTGTANATTIGNDHYKGFLKELLNVEMTVNMTIDKLNFIMSHLSYTQLEQVNTDSTLDSIIKTGTNIEQQMIKNGGDIERIKLLLAQLVDAQFQNCSKLGSTHGNNQNNARKDDKSFRQTLEEYLNSDDDETLDLVPQTVSATNSQRSFQQLSKELNQQCELCRHLNRDSTSSSVTDSSSLQLLNQNMQLLLSKLELFAHGNEIQNFPSDSRRFSDLVDDSAREIGNNSGIEDRNLLLLATVRSLQNLSLANDKELHSKIDQLTDLLIAKMKFIIEQSADLRSIKIMLQNSHEDQDYSSQSWGSGITTSTSLRDIQGVLAERIDQLRSTAQVAIDEGLLQIIDMLGQNKQWLQEETTNFLNKQTEDLNKMAGSTTMLLTKGFDNLQFMYQYLSGKLDKIHQIAAHNLEDCADIQRSGHSTNGIYTIYPRNSKEIKVYCDMDNNGVGWTVIQRRGQFGKSAKTSFNESWINYKYGFGNLEEEFWLGNEKIHTLTSQGNYVLRIEFIYTQLDRTLPRYKRKFWHDLQNGSHLHAHYSHFVMKGEAHNYSINYSGYMGIHPYDGFEGRTGLPFSTYDHYVNNHDHYCTKVQGGGWWYGTECFRFALNSKYKNHYWEDGNVFTGITWGGTADVALLQHVEMKILPHAIFQRMLTENSDQPRAIL